MPSTVRTISRLYLVIGAGLLLIGALTISLVAVAQSASTGACVNRVLGERAYATRIEQDARYQATVTELRYAQRRADRDELVDAQNTYRIAQERANAYRAAHPAGRC